VATGVVLLSALPTGVARAATASENPAVWAYGGALENATSVTVGRVALTYIDHSDYAVVLRQGPLVGNSTTLTVTRLLETSGYFIACLPDCGAPQYKVLASSQGTEFETAQLGMDLGAQVRLNGTSAAALGLRSEALTLAGTVSIHFFWENLTDAAHPIREWFNATSLANTTGTFAAADPLGLIPTTIPTNGTWSASSSFDENATTTYSGATAYAGGMIRANTSSFAGTATPISPALTSLGGRNAGASANPGDRALDLSPSAGGASLLEGAILVPTSAYLSAAFDSDCALAQRPCVAASTTPELDYSGLGPDHLGFDAAVSSVSAFALRFDERAVYDTPNGAPFWPAIAGVPPNPARLSPSVPPRVATVAGLPMSVAQAEALQHAFHPPANLSGTIVPPIAGSGPVLPPPHGTRGPGGTPPSSEALPVFGVERSPMWTSGTVALAGAIVAGLAVTGAVARRRRIPPPKPDPPEPTPVPELSNDTAADDDPMGYVW
jgi:hypothetical protein